MKHSEKFTTVAAALVKAKKSFAKAIKSGENTHLKNKYATLDDVLESINPALMENDLMVIQSMLETSTDKVMHIETMVLHSSGEWLSFQYNMPIEKITAQAYGSTTSYGRRYSLCSALGISQADDDAEAAKRSAADYKKIIEAINDIEKLRDIWNRARAELSAAEWKVTEEHLLKRRSEIELNGARGFSPNNPKENLAQPEQKEETVQEKAPASMSEFE